MTKKLFYIVSIWLCFVVGLQAKESNIEFPGRKLYRSVPIISIVNLNKKFNQVVIVDVRSKYEFQTLRIKGALNIPISSKSFIDKIKRIRKLTNKMIVVYCNGKTCMKSYKAAQKTRRHRIKNVKAYDQGVLDWAKKYPKHSTLLGRSPINPNHVISNRKFNAHLLAPDKFENKILSKNIIIVDVRDAYQRDAMGLFGRTEKRASLENFTKLDEIILLSKTSKKPLFIYDQAGKQVRWLMYYLEQKRVKNYYFMKGGARAFQDNLRKQYLR